jgi:primosomal protein N' (replication factor Y) (superfamily II helicase)
VLQALIVEVIVDVKSRSVDKRYDYYVPDDLVDVAEVGMRAHVSFGRQDCLAFVVGIRGPEPIRDGMKPILEFLDEMPLLGKNEILLSEWLCYRYVCTHLQAISAMLPAAFRDRKSRNLQKTRVYLLPLGTREQLEAALHAKLRKARKQARLLQNLVEQGEMQLAEFGLAPSDPSVRALILEGIARLEEREIYRSVEYGSISASKDIPDLTPSQNKALLAIEHSLANARPEDFVLYGVTGSGKTEVYLQSIAAVLRAGGGAIVLVPEIALTPQMVGRFVSRFGGQVAVLHSGLSQGEKRDEWMRIRRGEARIVVGARSAVFAPVTNLRLVIIDEEHESSYKQEESPRYEAREVARQRARISGAVVVSGSATPSLFAMRDVELGHAKLLTMPIRVNRKPLPSVEIVDMREELRNGNHSLFSRSLQVGLEQTVSRGEQAILFLNRRGFASFSLCRECGACMKCPNCDISLTVHKSGTKMYLRCHYCGHDAPLPAACPECGSEGMRPFGIGTQQIELLVKQKWPNTRVARMDNDTTRQKGAHQKIIQAFLNHEVDVLIGTQMIAKGLDFPDVSLVGVIAADTMLLLPDYRAAERSFQLLTQVSGRAGRAQIDGHTVIQTYRPDHFSIQCAAHHDFQGFYEEEKRTREAFWYPPYCELAVFLATHPEEKLVMGAARRFERELRRSSVAGQITILPASPCGISRIENKYRYQVVVKYLKWDEVRDEIVHAFHIVYQKMNQYHGVCSLDVSAGRIG